MASTYGSLVKEAIALLDKFYNGSQCLDDFIEDASKDVQVGTELGVLVLFVSDGHVCHVLQNMDAQQKMFILNVVSGCVEHSKLLDLVVNMFYGQNGRLLSRADRSQFVSKSRNYRI